MAKQSFAELTVQLTEKLSTLQGEVGVSLKFLSSNEELHINENMQFWAASVIKLPIVCEVYKQLALGKLDLTQKHKVLGENRVRGTGAIKLLDPQDEFTTQDLINLMMNISDNAATNALVDLIGWESVEQYMQELGLTNTNFRHKLLITAGRGPNFVTTADMSKLLKLLYTNKLPGSTEILEIMKEEQDRRRIPLLIPNEVEISHKTGSLDEAVHNVGIVHSAKNPFIFCFLSDDQKDKIKTTMVCAECAKLCYDFSIQD